MAKAARTQADLLERFEEQLGFLKRSAATYDKGDRDEAKRLALAIRILAHDTRSSHSLLGQLGKLPCDFTSSATPFDERSVGAWCGLLTLDVAAPLSNTYFVPLDNWTTHRLPFADWWDKEVVFADDQRRQMTRRDLILAMCNQDGGAHVDPGLDEAYADLSRHNSPGWTRTIGATSTPLLDPEKHTVRQIAHEVLRTLDPTYPPQKPAPRGALIGGIQVYDKPPPEYQARVWALTTGRNDPCPCKSGRKFKKCHGRAV